MAKIILASQSPRRRELLAQIGLEFTVCPSTVEESVNSTDPAEVVKELSRQKAEDVVQKICCDREQCDCEKFGRDMTFADNAESDKQILVIGADTIVAYQGLILGKPKDKADAVRMLRMLQGNTHKVLTGVTLIFRENTGSTSVTFAEETEVTMYPMSADEISWYVNTGEPMDKAGAYGIQGLCARFIRQIRGDYGNVVGLPAARVYQELRKHGGFL